MSDWQVGDLAVCVDDSPCKCPCGGSPVSVTAGVIYRVEAMRPNPGSTGPWPTLILQGVGARPGHYRGVNENRFRKIRPDEHRACEEEFVTLLKRSKRKVSA